jgi:hypothetical protein
VAAWGSKGWYDYVRPISAIRFLADLGQASDPLGVNYDAGGITLIPGYIELVSAATTAAGERHEHLAGEEGKIALLAWRGPEAIQDPLVDEAGVGWILAENWWPYQRPTFVTPPFAGYVSGHSTFSRAAAVVLDQLTGSPYFPGGLGEYVCEADEFLVFEDGPSQTITLQWASYYDASDQCSLSRIWGGIHPPADDIPGRAMGQQIGHDAWDLALARFQGQPGGSWVQLDLGGLAGVSGVPQLAGGGDLIADEAVTLWLTNARPSAPVFHVVGLSEAAVPFKSGVLVPSIDFVLGGLSTAPDGQLVMQAHWPSGLPSDLPLWYQMWVPDVAAPVGFAASNGVKSTTP